MTLSALSLGLFRNAAAALRQKENMESSCYSFDHEDGECGHDHTHEDTHDVVRCRWCETERDCEEEWPDTLCFSGKHTVSLLVRLCKITALARESTMSYCSPEGMAKTTTAQADPATLEPRFFDDVSGSFLSCGSCVASARQSDCDLAQYPWCLEVQLS